ncbi:MAG: AAA family ATPase [Pseudomonadota bacterium]
MIIHLNSYPGVGKLTIGRLLAARIGAKLLDNHSIYNVAFALTEFKSPEFYETVRSVRKVAYDRVTEISQKTPVILTNAHFQDSRWGNECWDEVIDLAHRCNRSHLVVVLDCSREENARRIQSSDRDEKRKPRNPALFRQGKEDRVLIDRDGDAVLRLDVTSRTAAQAAQEIETWIRKFIQ